MLITLLLVLLALGEAGIISYFWVKIKNSEALIKNMIIETERYKIAAEITNDILFEYDIKTDTMNFPEKYMETFGRGRFQQHYVSKMVERQFVQHEDFSVFDEFANNLRKGKSEVVAEFRMLDAKGDFVWCRLRGKTLYNSNKDPVKVIGKIVNIDIQKKELELLQVKSQMDPLTNVFNKTVTKEKINEKIMNSKPDETHALMIIDIDNFKSINDTHGHVLGDRVLINVVAHIKRMFREEDIVGRIGGDEFVVFMNHVSSREDIASKAVKLFKAFKNRYREKDEAIDVTGSIGISVYPLDGMDYDELLDKADKALYEVKAQGKNNFNIYSGIE